MPKDPASADADVTASRKPFRPDLSQSMSTGNESERILSSLKGPGFDTGATRKRSKRSFITLTALVLATAAAAFVGYRYLASQADNRSAPVDTAKVERAADAPKSGVEIGAKPAAPESSAPAATQAAQIVNEVQAAKEPTVTAEAKLTDALEKDVKPPKAALQKALESKPKPTARTEQAAASRQAAAPKQTVASKTTAQKTATPATVAQKNAAPPADKDINLIAALLAHNATSPSNVRPNATKSNSTATGNVQAKSTVADSSSGLPAAPLRIDRTELALKQCESLDFLQREVCKFRTCDQLWEVNPACKATLTSAK